jgi:hypothetical protein
MLQNINLYVNICTVLLLKPFTLASVLQHAGLPPNAHAATLIRPPKTAWVVVTPVTTSTDLLSDSKFYRSISQSVNDDEKLANFAVLMNGIFRAAEHQNYQEVLKGSNVAVKIAHEFRYRSKTEKIWELKQGKKDRVYFYPLNVSNGSAGQRAMAILLAHHKKDQTTPKEVSAYCETTVRSHLDPQTEIRFC